MKSRFSNEIDKKAGPLFLAPPSCRICTLFFPAYY
jgi:hypothetical protein